MVSGKYCSACGQSVEYHLHSMWDLLGEAAEVLTHADSRLWRTLGSLVSRPGWLTRQFIDGRRARYLSPFRLYFVLSVLFFVTVSIAASPATQPRTMTVAVPPMTSDLQGEPQDSADYQIANPTAEQICEAIVGHSLIPGANRMRQTFLSACVKSQADNGRQLLDNFIRNMGRAMFLFLPVLAGLTKLMYWRPRRSYVTHLLLLIHNQAFAFLVMAIALAASHWMFPDKRLVLPAVLLLGYLVYYLYRSMRRVYEESRLRTLLKFTALSVGYLACAVCTVLLTGLYSAEML